MFCEEQKKYKNNNFSEFIGPTTFVIAKKLYNSCYNLIDIDK